jgi:hypothetical protein
MPIQFSCFISYRHSSVKSGATYVQDFVDGFEEELARWVNYPISFDQRRLQVADFIDESLAAKLYSSTSMVVLYTPNYFSKAKMFCSREYFGMLDLEGQRIQHLQGPQQHGLIIPIALRDQATMITHVRSADYQWGVANNLPYRNRLGLSFEQFSKKKQLQPGGTLNAQLQTICKVIRDRENAFETLIQGGYDPFLNGNVWDLPAEHVISPWVNGLLGFVKPQLPSKAA